jgi:DNA-directed RNA polymerase subunit RPC12/RpoP
VSQQSRSTFVLREANEILQALIGLKDVRVLHYERRGSDVTLLIEQVVTEVRCPNCDERAEVKERPVVTYVDLPVYGTPRKLGWRKHRMRCRSQRCPTKTWVLREH